MPKKKSKARNGVKATEKSNFSSSSSASNGLTESAMFGTGGSDSAVARVEAGGKVPEATIIAALLGAKVNHESQQATSPLLIAVQKGKLTLFLHYCDILLTTCGHYLTLF
jgi:hypothetical protein